LANLRNVATNKYLTLSYDLAQWRKGSNNIGPKFIMRVLEKIIYLTLTVEILEKKLCQVLAETIFLEYQI